MRKIVAIIMAVVAVFGIYSMIAPAWIKHSVMATNASSSFVCSGQGSSADLKAMAKQMAQVAQGKADYTKEVRSCYATLSFEAKARLFELVAAEQGIMLEQPSTVEEKSQNTAPAAEAPTVYWDQLIEHANYITSPAQPNYWQRNDYCDGSDPDEDYQFRVDFPGAVTNPNGLRNLSGDTLVDSMLIYYQWNYGGIKGSGYTESGTVWTCLGGGGVNNAGGPTRVYTHLRLSRCLSGCW